MTSDFHLPIDAVKAEFETQIEERHMVIQSDTGSGKSTRLPLWAADGGNRRVLVVEPRRVACVALADFLGSDEICHQHGLNVGYAIRFENQVTQDTQLAFVTPGIALNWFADNGLEDFDLVIIDEFHERRWDTDLLLALLRQRSLHRLLLTSATIDGERLAQYLGNSTCLLQAQGKRFHVELRYLANDGQQLPDARDLPLRVRSAVESVIPHLDGDILVFLPGKGEINKCAQLLGDLPLTCMQLHGGSDIDTQRQVLASGQGSRVILATNVAETSLTIPGVTVVIDSGLERRTHQRNGRTVLSLARISRASADQRLGRAGRVREGICIRLWGQHAPLEARTPAELLREELTEPMLAAAACGKPLQQLEFVDELKEKALAEASSRLETIAAIDADGKITDHGRALFPLPIDTQFAHLISAMEDDVSKGIMVDLCAAMSLGRRLWQTPSSVDGLRELAVWEPLGCDAMAMIKLLRQSPPEFLNIDLQLRREIRQLANQIRTVVNLPPMETGSPDDNARQTWLCQVIKALPELTYVQRQTRDNAYGNGRNEVQVSREGRFAVLNDNRKVYPEAAVVLDQFSLPGRGVRQTLNMGTCMVPVSWRLMAGMELGTEHVALEQPHPDKGCLMERIYGGRVIASYYARVSGALAVKAAAQAIIKGEVMPGLAEKLADDLQASAIWLALPGATRSELLAGMPDQLGETLPAFDLETYLINKLQELGVAELDDLGLLESKDLEFECIPDWCRQKFDEVYPRALVLPELKLRVEYDVRSKKVEMIYQDGARKTDPKRWELPRWQGWRIKYRKASRVVDIR